MNERILVVDDEKAIADLVGIYLTKEGFDVQIAGRENRNLLRTAI